MSTATNPRMYQETIPNLAIGRHTRVIYQGFTGRAVSHPLAILIYSFPFARKLTSVPTAVRCFHELARSAAG